MQLIKDKFSKKRGGYSRLFKIYCAKCNQYLFDYQKDGPGIFKRLYINRIDHPHTNKKPLTCPRCKILIGVPYIYDKEKRPAFRLFAGAIAKKLSKA